ncbi:unnamed protein product [Owenia fusiformis]|uniref:Uncharacterized protein n=1 Tax=Owenia fusiformis TaxID=6347 RepID=A0A8J1TE23_OWEFU|nr:unnamed protein product [Owenia fusiformis]
MIFTSHFTFRGGPRKSKRMQRTTAIILAAVMCLSGASAICKPGYNSYNSHCYLYVNGPQPTANWYEASAVCKAEGGYLVIIQSSYEQTFLDGLIDNAVNQDNFWIGGNSLGKSGYYWTNGNSAETASYTNWKTGQPDNWNYPSDPNNQESCMQLGMQLAGDTSNKWNDARCNEKYFYICEYAE